MKKMKKLMALFVLYFVALNSNNMHSAGVKVTNRTGEAIKVNIQYYNCSKGFGEWYAPVELEQAFQSPIAPNTSLGGAPFGNPIPTNCDIHLDKPIGPSGKVYRYKGLGNNEYFTDGVSITSGGQWVLDIVE